MACPVKCACTPCPVFERAHRSAQELACFASFAFWMGLRLAHPRALTLTGAHAKPHCLRMVAGYSGHFAV
jgi:hypothetical protein